MEKKIRYTVKRKNGFIFEKIFTLEEIENGDVLKWMSVNFVNKNEVTKDLFIGVHDMNKKELYENDTVKELIEDKDGDYYETNKIIYRNGCFRFGGECMSLNQGNFMEKI